SDVAPLLQRRCVVCHGPEKVKGHFRLDSFAALLKPGSSQLPPVLAGQPETSHLYQLIVESDPDDRMPQNADRPPPGEVDLIRRWSASGGIFARHSPNAPLGSYVVGRSPAPPPAPERYRQPWPITALVFSPEGSELIASGYHEITFWDPIRGSLQRRLGGMPE